VSGDPVLVGELVGVAQTTEGENYGTSGPFTPPVWGTVPPATGFNEAGYASAAPGGACASASEGGEVRTPRPAGRLSVGPARAGDARFGHVVNPTSDGRVVVRICNPSA